jgi:phage-related protein
MQRRGSGASSWAGGPRAEAFEDFPPDARLQVQRALTVAVEGRKADIAKPMKGLGSGVYEIALRFRTDAYRAVYAVNMGEDVWVIHAFQKKSKTGIKTPQPEIYLIRERIKRLKEILQ